MTEMTNTMRSRLSAGTILHKFFSLIIMSLLCLSALLWPLDSVSSAAGGEQVSGNVDAKRLEGRWIRPDGGYILELRDVEKDGSLTASYFNPRQIRVFQALWAASEGVIQLFVELRDINYPGSKYRLWYDPATDRLQGIYFQAMENLTFEIEFVRQR